MKDVELIDNEKGFVDFKQGDIEIKSNNHIESYMFWEEMERAANRAMYRIKKANPKYDYNMSLQSMMTTPERQRELFIKHLETKDYDINIPMLFDIIDKEVAEIKVTGPDDNHPNPFLKFPASSDFMKSFITAVINKYEKQK